jgi:hypothetical protein
MYLAFALDHIPRRMRELGFGDSYLTRYRHFLVEDQKVIEINADNQYWFFIEPENMHIESERGVFDLADISINIQQHEHSGKIIIANLAAKTDLWVLFIQVIPQHKSQTK